MTASPVLTAVFGDVLWCLGLGLLTAAARDLLGLALGEGPLRCFLWDVLTFAAAAFLLCGFGAGASSSGVVRWYMMAGMLAGAAAWYGAVSRTLHALRRAVAGIAALPFRPLGRLLRRRRAQRAEKERKKQKNPKNQLQKQTRILYN